MLRNLLTKDGMMLFGIGFALGGLLCTLLALYCILCVVNGNLDDAKIVIFVVILIGLAIVGGEVISR